MRTWGFALWLACAAGMALPAAGWAAVVSGTVVDVIDGDTLVLADGTHVRLLDINTPEIGHNGEANQPYAVAAKRALRHWALGRAVMIETGPHDHDRYGRLLGQVYTLPGRGWVNGTLVRDGFAHVYTFADNALYAKELLAYEQQARAAGRGLWALPGWQVRAAATCCAKEDIGTFKLVEGTVVDAGWVKTRRGKRIYLNFGPNWRTDFTVFIDGRDGKWFRRAGIKAPADYYEGKTVRVRGYLQPVNGVQLRVTHPAQIEIVGEE